ncbi:hypothetical protein PCC7418_2774 [Halothece sp. PCC 7418]|uniref:polysaccharide pyruvyl transferase family protein n=1 Tax=Halothece sp. (strain PCC 7418) TaxID=65093 RepID=UPI0002A079C6|nr:polysaccharide pyruvyl transferase family protein [Halothece sp. PCC 7418]AFZ44910.1 hypothetical protein PCC7418_2774 [Halothece sp. PCC 7418]
MKLFYFQCKEPNFGDDLNPWLWSQLFPLPIENYFDSNTLLVGIGSILSSRVPEEPKKVVFGSGYATGSLPVIDDRWRFFCVRGLLTAKKLELSEDLAIGDSATLLRLLFDPAPEHLHHAAFMPHHITIRYEETWKDVCQSISIELIDPRSEIETIIQKIRSSRVVITESLHGAIVADAFRVPWIPVRTRAHINHFKWQDWSTTVGIEHEFEWLPQTQYFGGGRLGRLKRTVHPIVLQNRLRWLARFGQRRLSTNRIFQDSFKRLTDKFDELIEAGSQPT